MTLHEAGQILAACEYMERQGPIDPYMIDVSGGPFWPLTAPLDGPDLDESRLAKPYGGGPSCD